jgi:transposase
MRELGQRAKQGRLTIGLDLGDRTSHYCVIDAGGEVIVQDQLATTKTGLNSLFGKLGPSRVALEVGTHSPWASRHLAALGHEVIVANPRNVEWITQSRRKNDRLDAEKLARMARVDPKLLSPIRHRGEQAQRDLAVIRTRMVLINARTQMVNSARGQVKSFGQRLASCDCDQVGPELGQELTEEVRQIVEPLLQAAAQLTKQIKALDERIHQMTERYPEIELLTAIYGVGELTAVTFVLTLDDAGRFGKSREVGPYLGLVAGQHQSGKQERAQRITKEGDHLLRRLLVQCAHCLLKQGAPDSDLRRWGLAKMDQQRQQQQQRSGKKGTKVKGKKRVLVAVARRLAVLMHKLWINGEVYEPLYQAERSGRGQRAVA